VLGTSNSLNSTVTVRTQSKSKSSNQKLSKSKYLTCIHVKCKHFVMMCQVYFSKSLVIGINFPVIAAVPTLFLISSPSLFEVSLEINVASLRLDFSLI